MKRKFYLMIEGIDEEYVKPFFDRFGRELQKEKGILTKLRNYEEVGGHYILELDSRNFESKRKKIIKTRKFEEKTEKCIIGIYLPDNIKEFLDLCKTKTTLVEAGEGRDAVLGKIFKRERKGEKEYYLKGEILNRMRGALIREVPLAKVLEY